MSHALLLALALALAVPSEASIERGRALFADPDLGANGKTCVLCHAGGRQLDPEVLRAASPKDVGILSNHCLSLRMKSPKLPANAPDLQSLILYVKTFQQKGR
jgi:cytochrome c peroxidase